MKAQLHAQCDAMPSIIGGDRRQVRLEMFEEDEEGETR